MPAVEQISYKGWENCCRISNGKLELVVTLDVGPRVIRLGFVDGPNMLANFPEMMGQTGGDEWRIYGGHRLWAAPEVQPRSYYPDNAPVTIGQHDDFVRFIPPVEAVNGITKEIDIALDESANHATVTHRIRNVGVWPIELAPWALSVMDQGGTAIIPLPPRGTHETHLLPANSMTFWAYTDMSDPRWTWGEKYILLRQDPAAARPQKVGAMIPSGWAAYAAHSNLFVKTFQFDASAVYPDMNCNVETFTNSQMLELETLGPLVTLNPGEAVEHVEQWYLFAGVEQPASDADVDANILPVVQSILG
ncbi:MAG: hypothetical protein JXN59_07985 [Anaerolineae bacterium]|nr:hypothetical protein [Anaerolineae bacterium]